MNTSLQLEAGGLVLAKAKVDAEFFAGTSVETNFICAIGYGTEERLFPRLPRLPFDEACQIV